MQLDSIKDREPARPGGSAARPAPSPGPWMVADQAGGGPKLVIIDLTGFCIGHVTADDVGPDGSAVTLAPGVAEVNAALMALGADVLPLLRLIRQSYPEHEAAYAAKNMPPSKGFATIYAVAGGLLRKAGQQ